MKLTLDNFKSQVNNLKDNQYFVIENEDEFSFAIALVNNIARHYLIGYWELPETLKMYVFENCDLGEMFEFISEEYLEPGMDFISHIRKLK
ncbi:hypothetical protein [Paenibacillus odorifer]|uniref:hypothetical protein n=1 Tax=Paenibacillus odorifer TaxID=189426 RepID=UPI00096E4B61|nr:hypothetical protein [Paenibacillus odorifer]OMD67619.1 hypothetical protein BSK50_30075 [Paenibacillus odorifer]